MFKVLPVQAVWIGKDRRSFFKRDAMLLTIPDGFLGVPREHIIVYTLIALAVSTALQFAEKRADNPYCRITTYAGM
jgi:hypothetical protein